MDQIEQMRDRYTNDVIPDERKYEMTKSNAPGTMVGQYAAPYCDAEITKICFLSRRQTYRRTLAVRGKRPINVNVL